jgi:hypothetical protein
MSGKAPHRVCLLSKGEAAQLREGRDLDHSLHGHCSEADACELLDSEHGDRIEVVGPHHLCINHPRSWRVVHESEMEDGTRLRISTFQYVQQ